MKISWRTILPILVATVICGCGISWQIQNSRARKQKIEDAGKALVGAEQGNAGAEVKIGSMYYHGEGVDRDYAAATAWFRKAADQGNSRAQYDMGRMYDLGEGVAQDYNAASRWYHIAASNGETWAQFVLGTMYYEGRGVQQDQAEAVHWYRLAAEGGLAEAQSNLAYMYYHGKGVAQDQAEANLWYQKAADQGDKAAQQALGLRTNGLGVWGGITLATILAGCLSVLKDILSTARVFREHQRQLIALGGVFGLIYVVLRFYRAFGAFHTVLGATLFDFFENLALGILIGIAVYYFSPKYAKVILYISPVLLVGVNLRVIPNRSFWGSTSAVFGLSLFDGLLLGISIAIAISLWLIRKKDSEAGGPGLKSS